MFEQMRPLTSVDLDIFVCKMPHQIKSDSSNEQNWCLMRCLLFSDRKANDYDFQRWTCGVCCSVPFCLLIIIGRNASTRILNKYVNLLFLTAKTLVHDQFIRYHIIVEFVFDILWICSLMLNFVCSNKKTWVAQNANIFMFMAILFVTITNELCPICYSSDRKP